MPLQVNPQRQVNRFVDNLFRLTPYMPPFLVADDPDHSFRNNARLAEIVEIYRFDSDRRPATGDYRQIGKERALAL